MIILLTSAGTLQPVLVNPDHVRFGLVDGNGYTILYFTPGNDGPSLLQVTESPGVIWLRISRVRSGD